MVASEALVRQTVLRHLGTAVVSIALAAVVANLGFIPAGSTEAAPVPVYDGIFAIVAPLSIFWILLRASLRDIVAVGVPGVALFGIGAAGTTLGVVAGMAAIGGPGVLAPLWPAPSDESAAARTSGAGPDLGIDDDTETVHPLDLGLVGTLGFASLWASNALAGATGAPAILILTVIAVVLAQVPAVARLRGAQTLGMFAIYLFLAVIGAFCDLSALADLGRLGGALLALAAITVAVHGLVVVGAGRLMTADLDLVAVASQAGIGGSASALALARSLGRNDLVLPAILLGSLGNALGTFVGFWLAGVALPALFG